MTSARPPLSTLARRSAIGFALLLGLAIAAFWPPHLSKPFAGIDRYTHFHAAAALSWFVLIIGQAVLIHTGRRRAHRVIGRTSFVLAPLLVVSAVLLAHYRFAAMHETRFAAEAFTLYLPLYASVLFGACYGLAIAYRRHADAHARLMACTAVVLVDPVLARLLGFYLPPLQWPALYEVVTFAATDALLVTLMQSAPTASMARMLLRRVLALFVAAQLLWFTLARSAAWFAFAAWFRSLPLT